MASPGDLEARITRLEQEVARLHERLAEASGDAAAARVLASGADRDVAEVRAELRAHTRALTALRETQVEFSGQLAALDARVTRLEIVVEEGFAEMRAGFTELRSGMAQIVALLGGAPST